MSLAVACAQALAAITRARSLFSESALPTPAPGEAASSLRQGAQTTTAAVERMSGLSGQGVDGHQAFAGPAAATSATHAGTDTTMGGYLDHAAAVTQTGAARMEAIQAQARAIAAMAPAAKTPADQRMILAAMQSKVAEAQRVTEMSKQQAAGLAAGIRSLTYQQAVATTRPIPSPAGRSTNRNQSPRRLPRSIPRPESPKVVVWVEVSQHRPNYPAVAVATRPRPASNRVGHHGSPTTARAPSTKHAARPVTRTRSPS
jgi:hypothetical protein